MGITQILNEEGNTLIVVSPAQLREYAMEVVSEFTEEMKKGAGEEPKYTPTEFAKRHGVNKSTLYRWCKAGLLQKHSIGGKVYYRDSDLKENL